ncbi:MAG: DNA-directed RNA polymerase subunit beta' [Actinobacteria bacterium]|nr:DNA-directed RNA polymerase subunit beta' [Actinomycetota bacterium]
MLDVNEFKSLKIGLANAKQIRNWSNGEVKKPETINYRTLKPEKEGLFCERIFGPTRDWECSCGKYKKRVRFKGMICERCGVEVTRSKVRRERMGHIELAASVSHIWFFKGVPSRMGYLLDLSSKSLERVLYFASYIVIDVKEEKREKDLKMLGDRLEEELAELEKELEESHREMDDELCDRKAEEEKELDKRVAELEAERTKKCNAIKRELKKKSAENPKTKDERIADTEKRYGAKIHKEKTAYDKKVKKLKESLEKEKEENLEQLEIQKEYLRGLFEEFKGLEAKQLIDEDQKFRDLRERYGEYFRGGMGAETVRELLLNLDLKKEGEELRETIRSSKGQKRNKATKRLKVVSAFLSTDNKPEAMILDVIPVIPPDLRPMVQLDGGRFATSDLNDLYRRVINRNNRLKRLLDLGAPEIIVNNEKRMLQEAVDALFDNGRRGRPVTGPGNRPLKSLSDMLKGKQGRFRQNLLGKRVDYSGRSVIVVGPELELHQCGLPKQMALELFKPFVMKRLVDLGFAHNIKGAKRMIDRMVPVVWDVLEKVIQEHPVMLNRAPTLHRLGIQAFEPQLVEGKAIRIHPLVCSAFNADFDGDQMAVHLPLSSEAQAEARILMLSSHNILSPAHGRPIVSPTQDIVMGCYYLSVLRDEARGEGKIFSGTDEAILAYEFDRVDLQAKVKVRMNGELVETSPGRILFNRALPDGFPYQNRPLGKKEIAEIVEQVAADYDSDVISEILDNIKEIGFHYATRAGMTIGIGDLDVPTEKPRIIEKAEVKVKKIDEEFAGGFYTEEERHNRIVDVWHEATDEVAMKMEENFDKLNPIYMMARSGARGDLKQIKQLAGMKGLVENPKGEIISVPITSNFRQGLSVLEYFISTHGARKGLADTALRTADSGYLTRRLVDVNQDVIVREEDCGTDRGITVPVLVEGEINQSLIGRNTLEPVKAKRKKILGANEDIDKNAASMLVDAGIDEVLVRSVLTCHARQGVCAACFGRNLATGGKVPIGEAVGIIAAQSIGEPGTQLTMRTFHFGGVYTGAGRDITHGLPRVVELFEARKPKGEAELFDSRGTVEISTDKERERHAVTLHGEQLDESGKMVPKDYEYEISTALKLRVKDGDEVSAGQRITEGSADPKRLLEIVDRAAVQRYLVEEVQKVYKDQGVDIHDKHVEVVVRQMLKRVSVTEPGDSDFLPGQPVEYMRFEEESNRVVEEGGEPPKFKEMLMGITKASLATDSFLSAASFQETTRVLTDAALSGKVDHLEGLKENVILGKLVPTGSGTGQYRSIKVKPMGEEWEPLYTGEPLPEFDSALDAMSILKGITGEDPDEKKAEEEVDTTGK